MSIFLPANFASDIQGRDTNLVPHIVIGNRGETDWVDPIRIGVTDVLDSLPILLNIPSLKESIDIEKRNYKISNVNIDISNYPYNGKRFSEIVKEHTTISDSLINVECRIYWISPGGTQTALEGTPVAIEDTAALQIYTGNIRKYAHDNEKARIVVEDRSQASLHRDLPIANIGTGNEVPDKYKNKPIPMVYGHVDKSPCVIDVGKTIRADRLSVRGLADTANNVGFSDETIPSLFMNVDDSYLPVLNVVEEDLGSIVATTGDEEEIALAAVGATQWDANLIPSIKLQSNLLVNNNVLQCKLFHKPTSVAFGKYDNDYENDLTDEQIALLVDNDYSLSAEYESGTISRSESIPANVSEATKLWTLAKLIISTDPSLSDILGFKTRRIAINTVIMPIPENLSGIDRVYVYPGINVDTPTNQDVDNRVLINANNQRFALNDHALPGLNTLFGFPDIPDGTGGYYYDPGGRPKDIKIRFDAVLSTSVGQYLKTPALFFYDWCGMGENAPQNGLYVIYFRVHAVIFPPSAGGTYQATLETGGGELAGAGLREIDIKTLVDVDNILNKGFYVNIKGRVNVVGEPVYSAPEIITHILSKELEVQNVPMLELDDPIISHNWGDYAFTVDKNINSKKLIEGIASASPFIPHFDNMGNFKFDIIKDAYYETGEFVEIKAEDVISSSFSRTPIEDVKTKVIIKYNWDYARSDFGSTQTYTTLPQDYDRGYYGFPTNSDGTYVAEDGYDPDSESTLVIDDDRGKYIRNAQTAAKLATFNLYWFANQHLKIKVRMPLKYMNIEIGDIVRFDKIINVEPYGIDYSKDAHFFEEPLVAGFYGDVVNGQQVFPDFMVFSTSKTMEYCEIECIQMHNLSINWRIIKAIYGCTNPSAWNYNPDAAIDNGTCLLAPYWSGDTFVPGNPKFDGAFLQFGVNACYFLMHDDEEHYSSNYPDADNPMFDANLPYGNDIVPTTNNLPGPDRYLYTKSEHITSASEWYKAGYDPLTNQSTNMPKFYTESNCTFVDVVENSIESLAFSWFDIPWGFQGEDPDTTGLSPQPISSTLTTTLTSTGWTPNYSQSMTMGPYPDWIWDFHYLPMPMWKYPNNNYSEVNHSLVGSWGNQGFPSNQYGDVYILLKNIIMSNVVYNDDNIGSVQTDNNDFPMTRMNISVDPTMHVYGPGGFYETREIGGPAVTTGIELTGVQPRTNQYALIISNTGIGHAPPDDTDTINSDYIYTIFLRVIILNQFVMESDVTIMLRFGATPWGGPASTHPAGWGS